MQRRCARQLENCSISTPLPLSKTNLTGRWVVVVVVSRSTFDTTRFQESSKELQVLIKLWKPAVFHTRAPLFLSFLFPTNSSLSLSLSSLLLSFFFIRPSFERNYLLPRGLSRSKPAEKNGFSHFPIMQIPFKKETTAGCIDGGEEGGCPSLNPDRGWIEKIAGVGRRYFNNAAGPG